MDDKKLAAIKDNLLYKALDGVTDYLQDEAEHFRIRCFENDDELENHIWLHLTMIQKALENPELLLDLAFKMYGIKGVRLTILDDKFKPTIEEHEYISIDANEYSFGQAGSAHSPIEYSIEDLVKDAKASADVE